MTCPFCHLGMTTTYRKEDERGSGFIMRRVVEHNECENMKCGVIIMVIQPLLIKEAT